MPDHSGETDRKGRRDGPGPARLYALLAGAFLAALGVLGFFFDAGFDTGKDLSADDIYGIIVVNGWRNVLYLVSGLVALGFASRHPRPTAAALGGLYLMLGLWGLIETDHDIGSILEVLPLTNSDNAFHLVVGGLGAIAALADGPLPRPREHRRKPRSAKAPKRSGDSKVRGAADIAD
jgi:Domain of unknown function (DUF4383)